MIPRISENVSSWLVDFTTVIPESDFRYTSALPGEFGTSRERIGERK
jgi:hypothetical protein